MSPRCESSPPVSSHDEIQGWIARCLADPAFLEAARADPRPAPDSAPGRACAQLGDATLERLARFRGHITRVQHNGLRRQLPHTLRLLERLELDLPFFAKISASWVVARQHGRMEIDAHLEFFESHLRAFLEGSPERDRVLDCLTHERTLLPDTWSKLPLGSGVRFLDPLQLRRYTTGAIAWCCSADWRRAELPARSDAPLFFLYRWPVGDPSAAVYAIDLTTALLLAEVDGHSSLAAIAERVVAKSGDTLDIPGVIEAYRDLAAQSLLDLGLLSPRSKEASTCVSSS